MKSGSNLEQVLVAGNFAVTGELGPPKNADPEVIRKKARILKGHVDAANITDCQTAIVRVSSIGAGLLAQAEGVEPVIQMTCRDRNRIGMQSDILGAAALGLKNLLCLTGDHQKFGNHPGAKGVFDMDSIQLLSMVKGMRDDKRFQCGEEIKGPEPRLFLGAAANPFAGPFDFRVVRMGKKVASGADFIQTQIIYNVEKFTRFMAMARDMGLTQKVYILAGVTPPKSLGMARYMKEYVPGLEVPDEIISRMKNAKDKQEEGISICVDIIRQVKEIPGVAGVHVMAIEWESAVPEIATRAGLLPRPSFGEIAGKQPVAPMEEREKIFVAAGSVVETATHEAEAILARAREEAGRLLASAKEEIVGTKASARGIQPEIVRALETTLEKVEAGEEEMNERERQIALESVRIGLDALRKTFGLSDDQFQALTHFVEAEAILRRQPAIPGVPGTPLPLPKPSETVDQKPQEELKKTEEAKRAQEARLAEEARREEAKKIEEARRAEEARKAEESLQAAKRAEEARLSEEARKAKEARRAAEEKAAAEIKTVVPAEKTLETTMFATEAVSLAERAARLPADAYKEQYKGRIRQVQLGEEGKIVTVGGASALPFHLFEGEMPNKPLIAMEVLDLEPDDWPVSLSRHYSGVLGNPVAWAQRCVKDFGSAAICLSLVSTDPNGQNRKSGDAARVAVEVINAVDVPIILWGCGNAEKDTETLREVTASIGNKRICLAPLADSNYRSLGATAIAFQHTMTASSPIDVNLAKQLNILLENMGVSLDKVLIDPSIGALGYGIEYSYSVMERIRLAALTQNDDKLQTPFICNLGREVWKTKECRLPTDGHMGDQEHRGVLMEAITAVCMLMAGGEVLIMRHPTAVSLTRSLINGLLD